MSATNHTQTIELSQYVSTDKPTYLTDYNGDMLKIDNAIAADRDSISTAQNKANTADGKADANKLSIDTLNAQINGDPEDPSDVGLAGAVVANTGNINTINALLGNGSPTTSDQTVIGAINGLEASLAPREDGADLANSYEIGEQFARGGSVYTALTSLTAGTAFASLTLNTDYKNSDTLVEQIADVYNAIPSLPTVDFIHNIEVTADGVKTWAELLTELFTDFKTYYDGLSNKYIKIHGLADSSAGFFVPNGPSKVVLESGETISSLCFMRINNGTTALTTFNIVSAASSSDSFRSHYDVVKADGTITFTEDASAIPANGRKLTIKFLVYG